MSASAPGTRAPARWLAYAQGIGFVAIWMGIGFELHLDANLYLLVGIPLCIAFQLGVRRRPLTELWVRGGGPFRLDRAGLGIAFALALFPSRAFVRLLSHRAWVPAMWAFAAVLGAFAAGYSLRRFTRATARQLALCLATAGTIGVTLMAGVSLARLVAQHVPLQFDVHEGLTSMLRYFPVGFVIEEVAFRGLLDSHLQPAGSGKGILSAVVVSMLWGVWHYPIATTGAAPWWLVVISLAFLHTATGVPLSIFWRRSGNLAVPAFSHAFIDSVRDALLRS